jgi:hypothetical protein
MVRAFDIAVKYLTNNLQEDIVLSALNFLYKFLDEPISITYKNVPQQMVKLY